MKIVKRNYHKHKETIHNFFWRSLQIFGKQGITFLIFILCAKLLTPYDFGIYNYVLAIIFTLIMFGDFGISTATSKFVAEYNATDKKKIKLVLFNSSILILSITVILSFLVFLFGPNYLEDKFIYVLYVLPLIFLAPMTSLYDGIYRGLKRFKELAIISSVVGFLSIGLVYFFVVNYGLIGALIVQNIFYLLLLLTLSFRYGQFNFNLNKSLIMKIGKYSFIIGFSVIGYVLYAKTNTLVLGHYGFIEEIAHYEIINKIIKFLVLPIQIFSSVIAPNITEKFSKSKYNLLLSKFKIETFFIFIFGIFISFISFFVIIILLNLFLLQYNKEIFMSILFVLIFIIPFKFINSYTNNGYIIPSGYAKLIANNTLVLGIFNLLLSILLINNVGYLGVVYSLLITQVALCILNVTFFYKKLRRNINER